MQKKNQNSIINFFLYSTNNLIKEFESVVFNFFYNLTENLPKFYFYSEFTNINYFDKFYWEGLYNVRLENLEEKIISYKLSCEEIKDALYNLQGIIGKHTLSPLTYENGLNNLSAIMRSSTLFKIKYKKYDIAINQIISDWKNNLKKNQPFLIDCFYGDIFNYIKKNIVQQDNRGDSLNHILMYYDKNLSAKNYLRSLINIKQKLENKCINFLFLNKKYENNEIKKNIENKYYLNFLIIIMAAIKNIMKSPIQTIMLGLTLPIPYVIGDNRINNTSFSRFINLTTISIPQIFEFEEYIEKSNATAKDIEFESNSDVLKNFTENEKFLFFFSIVKHKNAIATINLISSKIAEKLIYLEQSKFTMEKVNANMKGIIEKLKSELNVKEIIISDIQGKMNRHQINIERISNTCDQTSVDLTRNITELKNAVSNIFSLQNRVNNSEIIISDIQGKMNRHQINIERISNTCDQTSVDLTRNITELKNAVSNIFSLQNRVNNSEIIISDIQGKMNRHQINIERISNTCDQTSVDLTRNITELKNVVSNIKNLRGRIDHTIHSNENTEELNRDQLTIDCLMAIKNQNYTVAEKNLQELIKISSNDRFQDFNRVIKLSYAGELNNFNQVIYFIRRCAPSMRHLLLGYETIFSEMLDRDQLHTAESIKLGYKLKEYSEMSNFINLSSLDKNKFYSITTIFPSAIRDILWSTVSIRNIHYDEYLDVFDKYCADLRQGTTFTWSANQTYNTNLWKFVTEDEGETFKIKYINNMKYLSRGKFNKNLKIYLTDVNDKNKDDWKLVPAKQGFFKVMNINYSSNLCVFNISESFDTIEKRLSTFSNAEGKDKWEIKHRIFNK